MTKEEKAVDIWKRVATLNKIPEGFRFNKESVWARLEERLDEHRRTRFARRVFIAAVIVVLLALIIAIGVRLNIKRASTHHQQQQKTSVVNSINQNQFI